MDDLIYILLGIAWILYAAYRANQKQKRKATAPATPRAQPQKTYEQKPRPIETIFQELLGEEDSLEKQYMPEGESYDEIAIQDLEQEKKQFGKPKSILESIPAEEGIRAFDYSRFQYESHLTDYQDITKDLVIRDELQFDLRKAIIYAEILNRPYA